MNQFTFLEPTLIGLAWLSVELHRLGKINEKNEEMIERESSLVGSIFEIEDFIIEKFGLPNTPRNCEPLHFKALPTDKEIENRIKQLHEFSNEYLLSKPQSDIKILRKAQNFPNPYIPANKQAFYILPEIKVKTHVYTNFVFEEILLKKQDTVENIADDFSICRDNPDILGKIGGLFYSYQNKEKTNLFELLNSDEVGEIEDMGIKYIQKYIMFELGY